MSTPSVWFCGEYAHDGSSVFAVKSSREVAMRWLVQEHAEHMAREQDRPTRRDERDRVTPITDSVSGEASFTDGCDTYYIASRTVEDE